MDITQFGIPKGEQRYPEQIIHTLALLYNVINTDLSHFLKSYDLSMGKWNILIAIKHHGGDTGIRQVEISEHLIVTPSNMTKMLDKLQADGLVQRVALPGDRRVNLVRITRKGSQLLDRIWEPYVQQLTSAVGSLNRDQQRQLG
ncbi:MAG: MarR family transcriptional regulator, partial [Candidatus Omnitrophica bacterium]|nr:MarR family transcriptional regulator [Candidatus Omnitrophota bacterium]